MKKLLNISLFLLLLMPLGGFAQNLIPNGDFEMGPDSCSVNWEEYADSCTLKGLLVAGPDFWVVTKATPDRFVEGNEVL
jgi:hypothetical protein